MAEVFSVSGLFTLLMLILLQAVLGFDNLLYISIESKRVGEEGGKASMVRHWPCGLVSDRPADHHRQSVHAAGSSFSQIPH